MIATRILKIDLEIAEIFEVKDGTPNLKIDSLLITQRQKNNFGVTGANFNYLSYF